MEDRRIADRRESVHCPEHDEMRRITARTEAKVEMTENQISDLYDKHEEMMKLLNTISTCVQTTNEQMKAGFERQTITLSNFLHSYNERVAYGDKIIEERSKELAIIKEDLAHIKKSSWLLDGMNKLRDHLPPWVMKMILIVIALLALINSGELICYIKQGWLR